MVRNHMPYTYMALILSSLPAEEAVLILQTKSGEDKRVLISDRLLSIIQRTSGHFWQKRIKG